MSPMKNSYIPLGLALISGNLIVGTFKLFNAVDEEQREGCELWMRYVVTGE